jgi:hypothetical protein
MATTRKTDTGAVSAVAGDHDEYDDEYDVGAAFGEHAIEWWVYDGARLVPASAEQAAMLSRLHDRPARPHARGRRNVMHRRLGAAAS